MSPCSARYSAICTNSLRSEIPASCITRARDTCTPGSLLASWTAARRTLSAFSCIAPVLFMIGILPLGACHSPQVVLFLVEPFQLCLEPFHSQLALWCRQKFLHFRVMTDCVGYYDVFAR